MRLQRSPHSVLLFLVLALVGIGPAFAGSPASQRGKGLQPPPPPPFDSKDLAPWADVDEAKIAKGLALAEQGQIAAAIESLDAAKEGLDAATLARLETERERLVALQTYRQGWLRELAKGGKNLRFPVEGKMLAFKVDRLEDGVVHFKKARKGIDQVAVADVSVGMILDNLGRGMKKVEPAWLQAYLPSLAQREFDPKKIQGVTPEQLSEFEDYAWMLELGAVTNEILALSEAGYPQTRDAQMALIARLGGVMGKHTKIPALKGIADDLKSYAADLAKLAFAEAQLKDLLHGQATELGEGRWRITYEFDNPKEAEDFYSVPDLFEFCLPEAKKPADPAKSGWLHNESAIAWAGRIGMLHHVPFEGAMSARYEWKMSKIGKSFDIQGGNLVAGMAADPAELSYVGQAFIHSAWCYQEGQLVSHSNGVKPIYENRTYKSEVVRDAEGNVTTKSAGNETGKVSLPDVQVGPFFLVSNLNIRGRLERLELEGKPNDAGLTFLRRLRAYEHLETFGLDGAPPLRAAD